MNNKDSNNSEVVPSTSPRLSEKNELVARGKARRKLLGKGVSAVAVTLASKPVLAWHCRTPSVWGSMAMNPSTSLMKNESHLDGIADESWYIVNWRSNTARAGLGAPWDVLCGKFQAVKGKATGLMINGGAYVTSANVSDGFVKTGNTVKKYIGIDNYTITQFCTDTGITPPSGGVYGNVKQLFDNPNSFEAHIIAAQLHEVLLPSTVGVCSKEINLSDVANKGGSLTFAGVQWTKEMFIDYFEANWIAVANGTSQSLWSSWDGSQKYTGTNWADNPGDMTGVIRQKIPADGSRHYFTFGN